MSTIAIAGGTGNGLGFRRAIDVRADPRPDVPLGFRTRGPIGAGKAVAQIRQDHALGAR